MAFTGRDASARPFDHVFLGATPRDPGSWAAPKAHPVPEWTADPEVIGQALSSLGKGLVPSGGQRIKTMFPSVAAGADLSPGVAAAAPALDRLGYGGVDFPG